MVPWFRAAAEQLLGEMDDPAEALSRALARVTGFSAIRVRLPLLALLALLIVVLTGVIEPCI